MKNFLTISKKEYNEIKKNRHFYITLIMIPVIFIFIFLFLLYYFVINFHDLLYLKNALKILTNMISFGVLFIPIMIIRHLVAESFVGERERNTIETLLMTPISKKELIFGKFFVPFILSQVVWFGFVGVCILGSYSIQFIILGRIIFIVDSFSIISIFLIGPILFSVFIRLILLISFKFKKFMSVNIISSIISSLFILLIEFLFYYLIILDVTLLFRDLILIIMGISLFILNYFIYIISNRFFNLEQLIISNT